MFYLKYRPKKFSEVIGLESIIGTLQKALSQKDIPHAYLFSGPRGSGKTTTARLLAKVLNCENPKKSSVGIEVCNECGSCLSVNEGRFLDLIEIDAASNRGIDDMRSLREKVKLSPSGGKYKVYIIDEAHMLTIEAFNALLKTLEEPPAHAVFILATTEPQKIPETIKSRCHIFNFGRASRESLLAKIKFIIRSEGIEIDEVNLEEVARLAEGGFRDAETLLEQVVAGYTGFKNASLKTSEFIDLITSKNQEEALNFISGLYKNGVSLGVFTQNLLHYLRDMLLVKSSVSLENLNVSRTLYEKLSSQSTHFTIEEIYLMINTVIQASQDFKYTSIPQLPLEMAVIKIFKDLLKSENIDRQENSDLLLNKKKINNLPKNVSHRREKALSTPKISIAKTDSDKDDDSPLKLEEIKSKWEQVLKEVKPENHSLEALLRSSRPKKVMEGEIILEAFYKFHKDKLSSRQNLDILEKVLSHVLGYSVKVSCVLGNPEEVRNDSANHFVDDRRVLSDDEIKNEALGVFKGD